MDNNYALGGSDDEREREQNALLHEQLERRKRMRSMAVPTDDGKVRERLRAYGEPITLFGEGPGDRRDRLKTVQERYEVMKGHSLALDSDGDSSDSDEGEFYTEGSNDLLEARRKVARYSLARARKRIARQRIEVNVPLSRIINVRKEVFSELQVSLEVVGGEEGAMNEEQGEEMRSDRSRRYRRRRGQRSSD